MVDVNVGSAPNDGTGDPLRSAFIKLNTSINNEATARIAADAAEAAARTAGDAALADDIAAEQDAREIADGLGDTLRLVNVGGSGQAITAEIADGQAHIALGFQRRITFYSAASNTGADPTLTIDGTTYTIKSRDGAALAANDIQANRHIDVVVQSSSPGVVRLLQVRQIADVAGLVGVLDAKADVSQLSSEIARAVASESILAGRADSLELQKIDSAKGSAIAREEAGGIEDAGDGLTPLVKDLTGYAVGVDPDGYFVATGLKVCTRSDIEGTTPFAWGIFDAEMRAAIAVDWRGTTHIWRMQFTAQAGGEDIENAAPFAWAISDAAGRGVVMVGHDGVVSIPSLNAGNYIPPQDFGGDGNVFNIRVSGEMIYATAQIAGGAVGDVQRDPAAPRPETAVMVSQAPIRGIVYMGQSLGGGGSDQPSPIGNEPIYPHNMFFPENYTAWGATDSVAAYAAVTELTPYQVTQFTPISALGTALVAQDHLNRREPSVVNLCHSWHGGQSIDKFLPDAPSGYYAYDNALAIAGALQRTGAVYRETVIECLVWAQGENATAGYEADLERIIDEVAPAIAAAAGQDETPHVLLRQANMASDQAAPQTEDSVLATLAVARDRLGSGVTMSGPMYQMPLYDLIHIDNVGRMILGDQEAHAYHQALTVGEDWHPLWPVAGGVTRVGAVITVPLVMPSDAYELRWDDDWVPTVDDRGFVYSDDSSGASVASVEISGTDIIVTLTANPGAATGKTLSYAMFNSPEAPGWSRARGQLYAASRRKCAWHHLGFDQAPFETLRHYCVRFTEDLA